MTDRERWARLEELFDQALDHPTEQRNAFLDSAAPDDPDLIAQVRRMLAAHDRTGVLDHRIAALPEADLRSRLSRALANQYELSELLGSGGMSSVFRARELKHDRTIVIKVLQPGLAAAIGPHRFADEVRIAARLSHPHILALIDSGEADGLRSYVTPDVGGKTLRERLAAEGALPVGSAITLLRDIADALAHAHDAGVVHRDLKPDNVLCVGDHAFLLDFGVAKLEGPGHGSSATDPGLAIGTPGYMAPEQAAGTAVDHRADIFVWGLLAREILTGRRDPAARVADRADVPRTLVALVDAALEPDPAERPTSARALVAALDAMLAPVPPRRAAWPWLAAAAALVLVWVLFFRGAPTLDADMVGQPIAVAPLVDETADTTLSGIGRLAGDWITQGLHETSGMRVVAWPAARAAVEGAEDRNAADALRDATGAGTVVTGSVYLVGDSLRFQTEIIDARRDIVLAAPAPVVVHRDSATAGVRMLRDRVMGAFAVQRDERLAPGSAFASRPPTYAAYRLFDRALTDYNAYRYRDALAGMVQAWHLDTTFTAALVYAAYAAWNTSNRPQADSLVQEVFRRRDALSDHHIAVTEQIAASLAGDTPAALAAAERATRLSPGSRSRYNLALALASLNRPAEALAHLDSLDPDRGPMKGWAAYWSQRAYAAHLLGQHEAELVDAQAMADRHAGQRVTWVIQARANAAMGRLQQLDSLLLAAEPLPADVYWSQGAMRVVAAEELQAHGFPQHAARYFSAAEQWLRARLAIDPHQEDHQEWLLGALLGQRKWTQANQLSEQRLAANNAHVSVRGVAAVLAARRGDSMAAAGYLADPPAWDRGQAAVYAARVAAIQGRSEDALTLLGEALASGVSGWHWIHGTTWHDFESLRNDDRFRRLMGITADS
jgi:tRNA A-37 threonylcarbamoyl transferase component Bud32/TolB-like protein